MCELSVNSYGFQNTVIWNCFQKKKRSSCKETTINISNGIIDLKSLIIGTFCKIMLILWNSSFLFEAKRNFNISPEVTSYSYDLSNEDTLCAEINVLTLAGEKLQNGRIQCYTTGKKSSLCKLSKIFVSKPYFGSLYVLELNVSHRIVYFPQIPS